jgi:hypothetical protein
LGVKINKGDVIHMEIKVPLTVKYGSIYSEYRSIIENPSVIIDKDVGLMKWGSDLDDYYMTVTNKYKSVGFDDMADNLILIKFEGFDGLLSKEEICTFMNYMILCSSNGEALMKMLNMDGKDLKLEIEKLHSYGY